MNIGFQGFFSRYSPAVQGHYLPTSARFAGASDAVSFGQDEPETGAADKNTGNARTESTEDKEAAIAEGWPARHDDD